MGSRATEGGSIAVVLGAGGEVRLAPEHLVVRSRERTAYVETEAPVVFAGYGIAAEEHGWDDYAGRDVRGRIVALLEGFPEAARAVLPGGEDGYFGTGTHRLEAAAGRGAAAVIFLMSPAQGRRFDGIWRERLMEQLYPGWEDAAMPALVAWLSPGGSRTLVERAGRDLAGLEAAAARHGFQPAELDVSLRLSFAHEVREFSADNVVGVLPGSGDEVVVLTAHHDALGVGPADAEGDAVYNGGRDNASGTAALMVLADMMAVAAEPSVRSLVFVATTAEEADSGQLGSRYYIQHPALARRRTVLNLNLDGINVLAPAADVVVFPAAGLADLESLDEVIAGLGLSRGSLSYESGMHFSFDTRSFLERSIPGLTLWMGNHYRLGGRSREELTSLHKRLGSIHDPSDEYLEDWNEDAIAQHLAVYAAVVRHYAAGSKLPRLEAGGLFAPLVATSPNSGAARK